MFYDIYAPTEDADLMAANYFVSDQVYDSTVMVVKCFPTGTINHSSYAVHYMTRDDLANFMKEKGLVKLNAKRSIKDDIAIGRGIMATLNKCRRDITRHRMIIGTGTSAQYGGVPYPPEEESGDSEILSKSKNG
jgi:hypothetical protein